MDIRWKIGSEMTWMGPKFSAHLIEVTADWKKQRMS